MQPAIVAYTRNGDNTLKEVQVLVYVRVCVCVYNACYFLACPVSTYTTIGVIIHYAYTLCVYGPKIDDLKR